MEEEAAAKGSTKLTRNTKSLYTAQVSILSGLSLPLTSNVPECMSKALNLFFGDAYCAALGFD